MTGPTRRLFLAVDLPPGLARRLAGLAPEGPGVKRVRPEAIHLTLHFLGDVAEEAIAPLAAALDEVRAAPFAVELAGPGRFPERGPAAVLWVGLRESPALARLHAACGRAIRGRSLPAESRPFTPHVTIARLGRITDRRVTDRFLARPPVEAVFPVERFVLYASERTASGPRHEPLHVVPLGG